MKDYGWFKLLIMALGLVITVYAIPSLIREGISFSQAIEQSSLGRYWVYYALVTGATIVQLVLGIYMLTGGGLIVRYCLRKLKDRCCVCDYRLVEVKGDCCPECGTPFVRDDAATRVASPTLTPRGDS